MAIDAEAAKNMYSLTPPVRKMMANLCDYEDANAEEISAAPAVDITEITEDTTIAPDQAFKLYSISDDALINVTVPAASSSYQGYFIGFLFKGSTYASTITFAGEDLGVSSDSGLVELITRSTGYYGCNFVMTCDGTRWYRHYCSPALTYTYVS